MKLYKLSVRLMTYNHGSYIEDALKGIDIQKTNFSFEVVVGDDFSTDDTLSKIRDYNFANPNLDLRILKRKIGDAYHKERRKKGRLYNFVDIINNCTGEYVALLDGDDYWTDPFKLQKQVDFLEKNEHLNICFHRVMLLSTEFTLHDVPEKFLGQEAFDYVELLRNYNFIATASVVFRKSKIFHLPPLFYSIPFGDLGFYKLLSSGKDIVGINEIMGIYRIHANGMWSGLGIKSEKKSYLKFYQTIYSICDKKERKVINDKIFKVIREISKLQFRSFLIQQIYFYYMWLKYRKQL